MECKLTMALDENRTVTMESTSYDGAFPIVRLKTSVSEYALLFEPKDLLTLRCLIDAVLSLSEGETR
jgi:hypothetical protein